MFGDNGSSDTKVVWNKFPKLDFALTFILNVTYLVSFVFCHMLLKQ